MKVIAATPSGRFAARNASGPGPPGATLRAGASGRSDRAGPGSATLHPLASHPDQPEVIERILRHLNRWLYGLALRARLRDRLSPPTTLRAVSGGSGRSPLRQLAAHPPWLRQRKARGPPPSTADSRPASPGTTDPHTIDPVYDDDVYCVDTPADEDSLL